MEACRAELRALPQIASLAGHPPEPVEAQGEGREEDGQHEVLHQVAPVAGEIEVLVAEVCVRKEEGLSAHEEVGVVETEGQQAEQRAPDEDLQKRPGLSPKGEVDASPRRAAEPVAA